MSDSQTRGPMVREFKNNFTTMHSLECTECGRHPVIHGKVATGEQNDLSCSCGSSGTYTERGAVTALTGPFQKA